MSEHVDNHGITSVSAEPVTTVPETGSLVPQPHGGALRYGGTNKGGIGRPPAEVKSRSRILYERVLRGLERQMDKDDDGSKPLRSEQLVNIGQLAAKYGDLGDSEERGDVRLTVVRVDPQPYDREP